MNNKKESIILFLIIMTVILLVPLIITFVIYKIMMFVFSSLVFTAGNLITLYAVVSVLILATVMDITTKKK